MTEGQYMDIFDKLILSKEITEGVTSLKNKKLLASKQLPMRVWKPVFRLLPGYLQKLYIIFSHVKN